MRFVIYFMELNHEHAFRFCMKHLFMLAYISLAIVKICEVMCGKFNVIYASKKYPQNWCAQLCKY